MSRRDSTIPDGLSRRERQIMDIVYQRGEVTAAEVQDLLPEAPSNSAVRALLRILEDKGELSHQSKGGRYVYRATKDRGAVSRSALRRVVQTFFEGSAVKAAAALISDRKGLPRAELDALEQLIAQARKEGR